MTGLPSLDKIDRISRLVSPPIEEELAAMALAVLTPDDPALPSEKTGRTRRRKARR